jgi:hypothetical protein
VIENLQGSRGGRESAGRVNFGRGELGRILSVYSQRVASGEWRDYAIDQMQGRAVFSIFRHALDRPLFTITKRGDGAWEIANSKRALLETDSLDDALKLFARELRVVS